MALQHLGRPYRSGAKGPNAFDCSGFIHYVYKRFQISLPPITEGQIKVSYEIPPEQFLPGDLVFFRIKKDFHAGIMVNKREFIHASKSRGIAVDDVESDYWRKNFLCFRRAF
jgi:cell wall-associated NlpC family hydrolase